MKLFEFLSGGLLHVLGAQQLVLLLNDCWQLFVALPYIFISERVAEESAKAASALERAKQSEERSHKLEGELQLVQAVLKQGRDRFREVQGQAKSIRF